MEHQGTPGGRRDAPRQRPAREHTGQNSEEATPEQPEPVAIEAQNRDVPDGQAGGGSRVTSTIQAARTQGEVVASLDAAKVGSS